MSKATRFDPDAECGRCGQPKWKHQGVQLFCPFYSTWQQKKAPWERPFDDESPTEVTKAITADNTKSVLLNPKDSEG